jgi:FkbM family methyltransferase
LELVRKAARVGLSPQTLHNLSACIDAVRCIQRAGWRNYRLLRTAATASISSQTLELRLPPLQHPIHIRPGTSDVGVVTRSVIRRTYAKYLNNIPARFIIDAGANIGDTTAMYLSEFPQAKVAAIEPDRGNFELLHRNCSNYGPRALLFLAALWPTASSLRLARAAEDDAHSVTVADCDGREDCPGVTPLMLLDTAGEDYIDVLKCDIEGAELELFTHNSDEWLSRTRSIYVEIHTRSGHDAVMTATRRHGFSVVTHRDLHIFRRRLPDGASPLSIPGKL